MWQQFENRIYRESIAKGNFVTRIPNGVRVVKVAGRRLMKPIRTDCDFVAGLGELGAVFFDAKATASQTFNLASYVLAPKKRHQYDKLVDAYRMGNHAGYLIWFYHNDLRKIVWVPIHVVMEMVQKIKCDPKNAIKSVRPTTKGVVALEDWLVINLPAFIKLANMNIYPEDFGGEKC